MDPLFSAECSYDGCSAIPNGKTRPDRCKIHDRLDMPSIQPTRPAPIPCSVKGCGWLIQPHNVARGGERPRWLLIPGPCDACVEDANRDRTKHTARANAEDRLRSSRLPRHTWNLSLDPDEVVHPKTGDTPESFARRCEHEGRVGITKANRDLAAWLAAWEPKQRGSWVYVVGSVGTGKTTLLTARLADLTREGVRTLWLSESTLWGFRAGDPEGYDLRRRAARVSVLMLDDFASTRAPAGWRVDVIEALIGERYDRRLPTLISSNVGLEEVASPSLYGLRIADRLSHMIEGGKPTELTSGALGSWRDLLSGRSASK